MTDDNSKVLVNGAVGLTGMTRAIVINGGESTSCIFTLPPTFIMKSYLPAVLKADGSAFVNITACSIDENGQVTMTLSAAAKNAEIILLGELGRRDYPGRSASVPNSENPNYAGNP